MTKEEKQTIHEVTEAIEIHRKVVSNSLKNRTRIPKGTLEDLELGMDISYNKLTRLISGKRLEPARRNKGKGEPMKLHTAVIVHRGIVEMAKPYKTTAGAYDSIAEHFSLPTRKRKDVLREIDERNTSGKWTIQVITDNMPVQEEKKWNSK